VLLSRSLVVGRGSGGTVAVHVQGKDGPAERTYACTERGCTLVPAPSNAGPAPIVPPAAAPAPAPAQ
jgi:hypothetical protein